MKQKKNASLCRENANSCAVCCVPCAVCRVLVTQLHWQRWGPAKTSAANPEYLSFPPALAPVLKKVWNDFYGL